MTVTALFTIKQRTWRGWDDPGLPVGAYIAAQTVAGDASGGNAVIFFEYALEGAPVSGFFYNVEQITAHTTDAATSTGSLRATNWESIGPTGLADRQWHLVLATDGATDAQLLYTDLPKFPIFLGQPQAVPALATSLEFRIPNVLNRVLLATVQGYIWHPRSVQVDGGLRRPIEALYG